MDVALNRSVEYNPLIIYFKTHKQIASIDVMSDNEPLNQRAASLLKALIRRYINEGTPVGSKTLAAERTIELSPATIRNVMADLEERGYLVSPHTSAGRIPTSKGYRFFVDMLLTAEQNQLTDTLLTSARFDKSKQLPDLLYSATSLMSRVTNLASLVTLPKRELILLRHIEFVPLAANRVLVILVINDGEVQNRVIHTDKEYSRSELQQAGNYLTQTFANRELDDVRELVIRSMRDDRKQMDTLMQSALTMADQVLADSDSKEEDYLLSGQDKLIEMADVTTLDNLKELFAAFNEKQRLLHLLDKSLAADGLQIFIGAESGHDMLQDYSLVSMPYTANGKCMGVLGVIGPTRMPYDKVIQAIDVTAKLLGAALTQEE